MNDFLEKMKKITEKGFEVSKDVLGQAGEKVQDLGDKGVTKFELMQLERQTQKQFIQLGLCVYEAFASQDKKSVTAKDEEVERLVTEISRLKDEMKIKEGKLTS